MQRKEGQTGNENCTEFRGELGGRNSSGLKNTPKMYFLWVVPPQINYLCRTTPSGGEVLQLAKFRNLRKPEAGREGVKNCHDKVFCKQTISAFRLAVAVEKSLLVCLKPRASSGAITETLSRQEQTAPREPFVFAVKRKIKAPGNTGWA